MNLSRWMKGAAAGCLLCGAAWAQGQSAPSQAQCRADQPYRSERVRDRAPSSLSADEAREQPVVQHSDVVQDSAQNVARAYAPSREPPAGDPIKVRRSFQPELQASVLNAE